MASGIQVPDDVVQAFNDVKNGKPKYRYATFKFNDANTEVVVSSRHQEGTWQQFVDSLDSKTGCYAVFDFDCEVEPGRPTSRLLFVQWAPDSAPIKQKMLLSSTKSELKKKFVGIQVEVQATDKSELDPSAFHAKLK